MRTHTQLGPTVLPWLAQLAKDAGLVTAFQIKPREGQDWNGPSNPIDDMNAAIKDALGQDGAPS